MGHFQIFLVLIDGCNPIIDISDNIGESAYDVVMLAQYIMKDQVFQRFVKACIEGNEKQFRSAYSTLTSDNWTLKHAKKISKMPGIPVSSGFEKHVFFQKIMNKLFDAMSKRCEEILKNKKNKS